MPNVRQRSPLVHHSLLVVVLTMTIPLPKSEADWRDDTTFESPTEELELSDARALAIELVPELASYRWTDTFFDDDERDIAAVFDHDAKARKKERLCTICFMIPFIAVGIFAWTTTVMIAAGAPGLAIFLVCFLMVWTNGVAQVIYGSCTSLPPHTAVTTERVLHNVSRGESATSSKPE